MSLISGGIENIQSIIFLYSISPVYGIFSLVKTITILCASDFLFVSKISIVLTAPRISDSISDVKSSS